MVVILPNTTLVEGVALAERIRQATATKVYSDGNFTTHITVSIGVSSFSEHNPNEQLDMVKFADQALYNAKANGRNTVKVYNQDESKTLEI